MEQDDEKYDSYAEDELVDEYGVDGLAQNPYSDIQAWQGNVNGKYPVLMWYRPIGDVLVGSLFYTAKSTTPLQIIGTMTEGRHEFAEYDKDGAIVGKWYLEPTRNSIEGVWRSPTGDRQYATSLIYTDTAVTIKGELEKKANVSGTYVYKQGAKDGAVGWLNVKQDNTQVVVSFDNHTGAPAYNMAKLTDITLALENNTAAYRSTEYGDCSFVISFYDGFVKVDYIDEQYDCGFGHNADVAGVYIKQR